MCGIAGLIDPASRSDEREPAVQRMMDAMRQRGPDDAGLETRGPATLGMRRLAIFDPVNGHQPMVSADARFTIVFNGAIYNFRELRRELEGAHWSFRTNCDTEVLLAAYARWGAGCLNRLRGMFAFAVWDTREQTLFLARDPFGIKPLYYRHDGARLIFASELNALLASGRLSAEIDPESVADYLAWLAVPAPRTIYRDLFSLKPGDYATFREGVLKIETAWSFRRIPESVTSCRTRTEFIGQLRERLDDTVRTHVIADVPVGAFLSGGLDSAVVTGLMTRASSMRLRTFSIDFAEPEFSEAREAEATARHFGTEHHTTVLTGAEVARDMDKLLHAFDQPTGDGINTYYASQAARQGGVTVALSGLGGDELFGGYPSFRNVQRHSRWLRAPRLLRRLGASPLRRLGTRGKKLADQLTHAGSLHQLAAMQRRVFDRETQSAVLAADLRPMAAKASPFHPQLARLEAELPAPSALSAASAWELRTYMSDVLLRDSDTMSMRHSLELRVPFVDRPLIEWLNGQPDEFRFTPAQPKAALAEALADLLPPALLTRQKRGFTLPFATWMRNELRPFLAESFSDASVDRSGLFHRAAVQSLWENFETTADTASWSRVWSLAVLIAFVNRRGG